MHRVAETERSGAVNRELQHVFAIRDDRPLAEWTDFDRVEVDGLVLVDHDGFAALAAAVNGERVQRGTVPARSWDGSSETDVDVTAAELVPAPYLHASRRRCGASPAASRGRCSEDERPPGLPADLALSLRYRLARRRESPDRRIDDG